MRRALRALTLGGGLATVIVGVLATAGWFALDAPSVARFGLRDVAPVRPLIGLALVPAGLALLLLWRADVRGGRPPATTVRVLAGIALLASVLGLLDALAGVHLDPAEHLIERRGTSHAMPRGVAATLALAAVALLLTPARERAVRLLAQAAALVVMAVGLLLVLDVFLVSAFTTAPRTSSPIVAAVLVALGAGLAAHRPAGGPMALVASSLPSGALARRIGLAVLVLEPLIATAAFWLQDAGRLDPASAFAGVAAATLALIVAATAVFATRLAPAEAARARAEAESRGTAARLRDLYDRSPAGHCSLDPEGLILEANARLGEWVGRPREALLGAPFGALLAPPARAPFREALALLRAGRAVSELDLEIVAERGVCRPVAFAATPVVDADGALTVARVTVFDIGDRRRAEEQRALAEGRYRTIVETALEGVASLDAGGRVLFANTRLGELLGAPPDELVGRRLEELVDPRDRVAVAERRAHRIAGDRSRQQFEVRFPRRDGTTIWAIVSAAPEVAPDGSDLGTFATVTDVTEWRSAEQARHEADRRYRTIVETASEGLVLVDADGVVTFANAQAERMLQLAPGGLAGLEFAALGTPPTRERLRARIPRRRGGDLGEVREDLELVRADGAVITVQSVFTGIADGAGAWRGSLGMLTDVTRLRRIERERRRANERYRMIVETASEGVWLLDAADRTSFMNSRMGELLGLDAEDVVGCPISDFLRPEDDRGRRARATASRAQFDLRFRHRDGHDVWTLVSSTRLHDDDDAPAGTLLMVTDVSGRLAAERARRDADERARRIVESAQEGIAIIDASGAVAFANDRLAEMFGLPPEEVVGIDLRERFTGSGRVLVEERLTRRQAGDGAPAQFDFRFRRADGGELWTIVSLAPMYDADGGWAGSLAMLTDITERRRAEAERRAADERYRQIVETAREGIGTMDEQGRVTFVNGRVAEMLGLPRHELVGRSLFDLLVEQDRQRLAVAVRDAREGRDADEGDLRFRRPDGRIVWVRAAVTAMRDGSGVFTGFLGMLDDVTERKAAEQALQASERRLQAIIDESPALVAVVDLELRAVLANRRLLELTGAEEADLLGRPAGLGLIGEAREITQGLLARARDERRLVQEEHSFRLNGREWSWIASAFPLLDDDGAPYALAALATDVTDLKRAEREVRALNRELEARVASRTRELELANRDLATFSYTVAHDLRAPLRTIHGFSSLLLQDHAAGLSGDVLRYLELVEQGATEMAQLIEDLLTFARTGQGELERRTVATAEVVHDALRDLAGDEPAADGEVVIAADLPDCYADPRLLRIVFQNLLGNALKFTRGVAERRIEVAAEDVDGETAFVVRDNGAGFPPDRADRMFQMFQRLHPTDEFEGTGLGLAIVERIVHRHGGRAWAEGAVGEGATLRFTLGSEDAVRRA